MKILLLNENPVVTKLVTLSAQKTSDELDIITNMQDLKSQDYDLFAVDDTLYTQEIFDEVKQKVNFSKSLYICSRDAEEVEGFTETLRKPFLPTDLVELFANLDDTKVEEAQDEPDLTQDVVVEDSDDLDGVEDMKEDDEQGDLDIDLDEDDGLGDFDIDLDEDDGLDDLELSGLEDEDFGEDIDEKPEVKSESILDKDEVQEVQNLLQEAEKDDDDLGDLDFGDFDLDDDELNLDGLEDEEADELNLDDLELEEESQTQESKEEISEEDDELESLSLEEDQEEVSDKEDEEAQEDGPEEEIAKVDEFSLDNLDELEDFDFEDEEADEAQEEIADELEDEMEEETIEEPQEDEVDVKLDELNIDDISDEDLESTIEDAVLGLSREDLESEIDEDALLDMQVSDVDGLESLSTRDIKLAIGEEVEEEEPQEDELDEDDFSEDELDELEIPQDREISSGDEGVESLKKLLKALSDKDVAASLKGMKININITLGDK